MRRTAFLAASASLAALGPAAVRAAQAVPGGTHLVERRSDFDEAAFALAVGRPAEIRQLWEAVAFHPILLANIKNALNGLHFGFGYPANRIALVAAVHGPSSIYNYSDYIWEKYHIGTFFKATDAAGKPVETNVFLKAKAPYDPSADPDDEHGMYQDTSIEMLQKRGVVFLTCHTAVEEQSRALVAKGAAPAGMTPQQVADDILTHLIPGTIVVPSMVATIAVLQARYHYTYITPTFA